MAPEDRGKKRAATHKDYAFPRARSEPGIPSVEIDVEKTPVPAAPPGPEAFAVLPIAAKVDALHHVQQEHAAGFERIWEVRHVATEIKAQTNRIERLETIVAQDTHRVGQLIVAVEHLGETSRKAFDKSLANAEKQIRVDERLVGILDKLSDLVDEVKASNVLQRSNAERVVEVENRVGIVEEKQAEQAVAIVEIRRDVDKMKAADTEKVIRSDERRRLFSLVTKFPKTVTAIIAAAVAIAGYLGITHL